MARWSRRYRQREGDTSAPKCSSPFPQAASVFLKPSSRLGSRAPGYYPTQHNRPSQELEIRGALPARNISLETHHPSWDI